MRIPTHALIVCCSLLGTAIPLHADSLQLTVQRRADNGRAIRETVSLDPAKTAVVVVDMWDRHWCKTYTQRVGNLVPRMNQTLRAVRKLGIQVVFAPSDVLEPYRDAPQRKAMQAIPQQPVPKTVAFDPPRPPDPTDFCECGPETPCKSHKAWSRQHPDLKILPGDLIADCNNGRELLNLCGHRGIDTLIYMGVASNMCVQYRSCGMRNMKRHGLQAMVVADLVEAITANGLGPDRKPDRNFTPAKGSARVQRHLERHIAPTIESRQLIAAAGMDPHADDRRPHVVFVIAEREYDSARTLPAFAKKHLEEDYRISFALATGHEGNDRNDVPGLEVLYDADLLVLSMRRRALPVVQMDHLESYLRSGKPIVALRVSAVPFQVDSAPPGHVTWSAFDREVLGCHYQGYDSRSRQAGCDVWVVPEAADHPILRSVKPTEFHSPSWIYRQRPLAKTAGVLMEGRWAEDQPAEPVAWTNTYHDGRVFYTTLGHPDDFRLEPFCQLLLGGIRWAVSQPAAPDPAENADPKQLVRRVADAVLRDFPEPPDFNWGEGVMLTGMMRAYELTGDERYLKFVRQFADHHYRRGIEKTLGQRGYCGHWGPGFPMLLLYQQTKDKRYLELAEQITRFMLERAERCRDGGLSHFNGKVQLWVDTLDMCCPVFSNLGRITRRPELQREAVHQLDVFAGHLQNPDTGLYYHMWDEQSDRRTPEFWARGNGWVVMSYTEVLKNEPSDSPDKARLAKALGRLLAAIVALQDEKTGLWHTVLDAPDTYPEVSASAMFLYGMVEGHNRKLIERPDADAVRKAWSGLVRSIDARGRVTGVSAGTGPSDKSGYVKRSVGTYTWGTGAFLLAACTYAESDL